MMHSYREHASEPQGARIEPSTVDLHYDDETDRCFVSFPATSDDCRALFRGQSKDLPIGEREFVATLSRRDRDGRYWPIPIGSLKECDTRECVQLVVSRENPDWDAINAGNGGTREPQDVQPDEKPAASVA